MRALLPGRDHLPAHVLRQPQREPLQVAVEPDYGEEWSAEYDRTSFFAPAGRDRDRIARRWVPIRCSSIASFLRCSASSSVTTSMTTAGGRAPPSAWWCRNTAISLEALLASGAGG